LKKDIVTICIKNINNFTLKMAKARTDMAIFKTLFSAILLPAEIENFFCKKIHSTFSESDDL
jgi:hypothetical protein